MYTHTLQRLCLLAGVGNHAADMPPLCPRGQVVNSGITVTTTFEDIGVVVQEN